MLSLKQIFGADILVLLSILIGVNNRLSEVLKVLFCYLLFDLFELLSDSGEIY